MLLGVRIRNFDVFDDDKIGMMLEDSEIASKDPSVRDISIRMRNLNALIGRNNTGKTSFLMAMSFLKRCIISDVASASKADGRPGFTNLLIDKEQPASFDLFFKFKEKKTGNVTYMQYELELSRNKFGSPVISSEKLIRSVRRDAGFERQFIMNLQYGKGSAVDSKGQESEAEITNEHQTALSIYGRLGQFPLIAGVFREIERWFFCAFSTDDISSYYNDGNAPGGHRHLNSHGSNVSNVLEYMKMTDGEGYERIISEIKSAIPEMKKKKRLPENLASSPDKLFLYLLLLRDPDPHSTIFIETPDKDLYHDMVDVLADEMREFTMRNPLSQIIFSTHNPYIIESMNPREIWVFERDFGSEEDDSVNIRCAGSDEVVNALFKRGVGMGAIWYGGHLDSDIEYDDPAGQ
ncbi:MAG: AAA family ATPase [Clostridiales bacterium]|nr:AAA family ATPase [Clostridiales bacterium]